MEKDKFGCVFGAFTSTPRSEDWTTFDQLQTHSRVQNSVNCGSGNSGSSSSGTLILMKKTTDITIWSVTRNTNDCSSSAAEPTSYTASLISPPDHHKNHSKAETSAQCEIQKECEQRTSISSESLSSEILNLIVNTEHITIWSDKISNNYSSCPVAETPTLHHQSDIGSRKKKPTRTKLDSHQLQVLNEKFAVCEYIVGRPRRELAKRLGLSKNQIGQWFEYRRRCMRRAQARMSSANENRIPDYSSARL